MVLHYSIHDKEGNTLTSDCTQYFGNARQSQIFNHHTMKERNKYIVRKNGRTVYLSRWYLLALVEFKQQVNHACSLDYVEFISSDGRVIRYW